MPVRVTAEEYADKHAARLKASIPEMQRGIQNVTESPTEKAAMAEAKYLAGVQAAVQDGRWQAGLRSVSLEEWRRKMLEKGVPRVAGGIDAARAKVISFARELIDHENNLLTDIERMPNLTLEDSINRATTWIRGMAQFRRRV